MDKSRGPFILVMDNECHWYVIPAAKRIRWSLWLDSEESQRGIEPDYADPVGGNPNMVQFDSYVIR